MSESTREANGDSGSESPASPNHSCSTASRSISRSSSGSSSSACSSTTTATPEDSQGSKSNSSNNLTNGSNNWRHSCPVHDNRQPSGSGTLQGTEESTRNSLRNRTDEVIQATQQRTGSTCDTRLGDSIAGCPGSLSSTLGSSLVGDQPEPSHLLPSTSHSITGGSLGDSSQQSAPNTVSPPASTIDTNNNRNSTSSSVRSESLSGLRKNNFSKSASGTRLISRADARAKVCDCLSQTCNEKEHSNRRRFIESYYNSRTRLPSANAMSTSNINTPLNRLSECDEITKRLLSSPIGTANLAGRQHRRSQFGEIEKSRRASLSSNAITEQVSLFASSQFGSLGLGHDENPSATDTQEHRQLEHLQARLSLNTDNPDPSKEGDRKLNYQQQQQQQQQQQLQHQQRRSLSVCQDDTLKPQFRNSSSYHSANLNRAVSLACGSSPPRQSLTIIPLFGCDMKALEQFIKLGWILPPPIGSAVDHILAHGINAIGIFRKSGVKSRILTLKKRIETNQDASFEEINKDNEFSIYDIADLVKMWFRELRPAPLMTKGLIRLISNYLQKCEQAHARTSQQTRGKSLDGDSKLTDQPDGSLRQQLDAMMSQTHKALFLEAIKFFADISANGEVNQMTSQNLAICLTPSLCATESDQASILSAQGALKYCIDNYQILF